LRSESVIPKKYIATPQNKIEAIIERSKRGKPWLNASKPQKIATAENRLTKIRRQTTPKI
jgi:hypothetical protein